MTAEAVAVATIEDRSRAVDALELAFAADPVIRWFWPDPGIYRATFAPFVDAIAGRAFEDGTATCVDDCRAVALWLAPGVEGDEAALVQLMLESVHADLLEDLSGFADMVQAHHPKDEHWYLPFTGVDPFVQGKGHGSALLQHALERCDHDVLPAYLEASTVRSRLLYERFGFKEVAAIQVGSSPRVWAMIREPSAPA